MQEQRKRSQESGAFQVDYNNVINVDGETEFLGYSEVQAQATVRGLFQDGQSCERAEEGDEIVVILTGRPFTARAGVRSVIPVI